MSLTDLLKPNNDLYYCSQQVLFWKSIQMLPTGCCILLLTWKWAKRVPIKQDHELGVRTCRKNSAKKDKTEVKITWLVHRVTGRALAGWWWWSQSRSVEPQTHTLASWGLMVRKEKQVDLKYSPYCIMTEFQCVELCQRTINQGENRWERTEAIHKLSWYSTWRDVCKSRLSRQTRSHCSEWI